MSTGAVMAAVLLFGLLWPTPATGQLFDGLERLPVRWQIAENDCGAKLLNHQIEPTGGHDRRPCEAMTLAAGHGTRLLLEYRITPCHVIDELYATLWLRHAREGGRIGMRVRYPYLRDPHTDQTVTVLVFGSEHRKAGKWEQLRIGNLPRLLRSKEVALRVQYGARADLRGAFVDAVVVDVYSRPGAMTVGLDDVAVERMVPVGSVSVASSRTAAPGQNADRAAEPVPQRLVQTPLPQDRVTKILEHNGEPLAYLRNLGFDAVLLPAPPTDEILREASRARMRLYAPPPSAPDPDYEALLEPVAGWYLGTSLDRATFARVQQEARRIERLPARWQRGTLAAPAEDWSRYGSLSPALVYDLPPTTLGLSAAEQYDYLQDISTRTQHPVQRVIGVQSSPPRGLVAQLNAFANHVGAASVDDYGWQPLWKQSLQALQQCPQAILFRSASSLASGQPVDQKRALALGYVNRWIEAIGPLAVRGRPAGVLRSQGREYHVRRIQWGGTELLLATAAAPPEDADVSDRAATRDVAADETLGIELPPTMANRLVWRLTGMTIERLDFRDAPAGTTIEIARPDTVEILLVSDDPGLGHRIAARLGQSAMPAALDRWQLTTESVLQTRLDWESVVAARMVPPSAVPTEALVAAANTLVQGEPLYRGGDGPGTLRLARRADAWTARSRRPLLEVLRPRVDGRTSVPPLMVPGGVSLQVALMAQLQNGHWSRNLLPHDAFSSPAALAHSGWLHDRRMEAGGEAQVQVTADGPEEGPQRLRMEVVPSAGRDMPGGYAGTALRVRSPAVDCPPDRLMRIATRVRTLGFGGPFQGVLVYDSLGGPEMGVLVRSGDRWQSVELYRHTGAAGPLQVMFEVIGAGEAVIEDVSIRMWDERPLDVPRLRPITP
ncbi:hypothetical protein [Roseimaritima sediminicola]|uniref:hypothetical protein n=1 Tax=Roseimaritima sediminicola TaxID=2662066 RepID=UPI0012983C2C|nr:hypothetical protein [Roseimaritima sediminicola]